MTSPERPLLTWSDDLLEYDFGPGHPMSPLRLRLTMSLAQAFGLLDRFQVQAPVPVSQEVLESVHKPAYIAHVRAGSQGGVMMPWGLGGSDNPVFESMHRASARVVGGTVAAALAVWSGQAPRAINPAGGLHHAMPGAASGFCIYNDVAVAIAQLLAAGATRVAYVDVDAHHGDGVERVFWNDDRVLTISVHQSGATLFPGTGFPQDIGGPNARGFAVNVALPADTEDAAWLRALEAVAEPLIREWQPQIIVSQHGADSHRRDPITDLDVSIDAQRAAALLISDWAREHAGGRWVATGGGGYDLVATVPRAWTHVMAIVAGEPIDPSTPTPPQWRAAVNDLLGRDGPATMTDGRAGTFVPFHTGYDPDGAIDRAILATRRAVFPEHGLDPLP